MKLEIPETTPDCYLTGKTALNIPSLEGTGDWHTSVIFSDSSRLGIVGKNFISTKTYLGDAGIFDATERLKKHGISCPAGRPTYAADHYRAVVDMVLNFVIALKCPFEETVQLDDWFPLRSEKQRVIALFEQAHPLLPAADWETISSWLRTQQN